MRDVRNCFDGTRDHHHGASRARAHAALRAGRVQGNDMHVRRTVRAEAAPASSAKSANFLAGIISFRSQLSTVPIAQRQDTGGHV